MNDLTKRMAEAQSILNDYDADYPLTNDELEDLQDAVDAIGESVKEIERLTAEVQRLREALHPGKKACDCCELNHYKGESFWDIDCQCGNHDDIGRAQAWCSRANAYEGATGSQVEALDEKGSQ